MTPRERLDELEALLDDLRRANANTPILVEGANDRKALEQLGCTGRILLVHDGERLIDTADRLARDHASLILLLDWDRTGGSIHHRVKEVLETHAVDVDERFREEMARLARSEAKTIEEMPSVLRRLRERVGRVK
jgi:5S rRNA maturation endonuclease (ribonuclease M5)